MIFLFNRPIRAVIFDLDNCLIQSAIDFRKIKLRLLELIGSGHSTFQGASFSERRVKDVQSQSIAELLQHLKGISINRYQQALELVEEEERKGCQNVKPMPCANELLVELTGHGVTVGLLTNNTRNLTTFVLERLNWRQYFDQVVTRDDVHEMKPSPEGLQLLLQKWQLDTKEVMYVGDSWIDEVAASKAGIPFIGIVRKWQPGSYHDQKKASKAGFPTTIAWLDELCELRDLITIGSG